MFFQPSKEVPGTVHIPDPNVDLQQIGKFEYLITIWNLVCKYSFSDPLSIRQR